MTENYKALANAVIMQAVKDFRTAYRMKKKFPDSRKAEKDIREITSFFCSQYFESLTDLDGPMLLKKIIEKEEVMPNEVHTAQLSGICDSFYRGA